MVKDNQVLVRLNDPQYEAFKEFADDRDYNHAEASREIIKSRLTGEGYLQSQHYGGPVTDGGIEKKVDETKQVLQNQSSQLHQQNSDQLYLQSILFLTMVWYAIVSIFAIGIGLALATGLIVFGGLSYGYYHYLRGEVDV